jgi:aspartyl-tRNA(Asn)/glutamyl-tRNA(Gln) amidotransferase subunit A
VGTKQAEMPEPMRAGAAACLRRPATAPDGVAWHRDTSEPARLRRIDGIWITEVARPAEGVRLAVKDLFDTAGLTTTYGSVVFADHVPGKTAEAVRRLEDAGYANVGKANLHEFAYGTTSLNVHFGAVPNPIAPDRIAGGSSGGSAAALAAGLADAALGTDSGGSIRIPSACCGTVGLKPTYGLVSLDGCFPLAPSFDHAGPMARDVAGCTAMMHALVPGFEAQELESLEELRVGIAWLEHADQEVRERVRAAAELFPRREILELPFAEGTFTVFMREVADVHRALFPDNADAYGAEVRGKIEGCLEVTDRDAEGASKTRELYREHVAALTDAFDLIVTPTLPIVAPPAAEAANDAFRDQLTQFTYPINVLGRPALALPCGPAEDGLPASVQLVGRSGEDALVLAAGALLESALAPLDRGRAA